MNVSHVHFSPWIFLCSRFRKRFQHKGKCTNTNFYQKPKSMYHSNDCKRRWQIKSLWVALAFFLICGLVVSCDDYSIEDQAEIASQNFRYASVTELYKGKAMGSARSVLSTTGKSNFEIVVGSALKNGVYIDNQF